MAKKKLGSNVANKIRQVNVNGTIYDVQDPDLEVELPKKLDKPENPTAGNAIVYDGTNWAKQDGYGYTTPGDGADIQWDGDTTGRDDIDLGEMHLYKVSELMPSSQSLNGGTVTGLNGTQEVTFTIGTDATVGTDWEEMFGPISAGDGSKLLYCAAGSGIPFLVSYLAQTITFDWGEGETFDVVVPSTGIFFNLPYGRTSRLKYGTASVVHKIDTKYIPVSANPASPTTDLTGVQIGETKYRIKGMQDGTSAGDALVWTGSTWEVQDGYGYTEAGSQTTIDWDGDTTSKDTFNVEIAGNQFSFYKVGSYVSSLPNTASVTFNSVQNTVNKYDGTGGCAFIAEEDGPMVFNVHAGNFSITFIESVVLTGTAPSDGLYLLKIGDLYVSSFTYGAPAVVHQINSKYIPHDTTKADLTRVEAIEGKIPNQATSENQLADKAFVNSSINAVAAYYITSDAEGNAFPTYDSLISGPWYYAGAIRVPTKNDYAIVVEDRTQAIEISEFIQLTTTDDYVGYYVPYNSEYVLVTVQNKDSLGIVPGTTKAYQPPTTRYTYTKAEGAETGTWAFQYIINNAPLTAAQQAALNSGITSSGVTKLNGIEAGAQVNVQADWNQETTTADDYIKNKPSVYTKSEVDTALAGKVSTTVTVNGHALSDNVTVTAADTGALPLSGGTMAGGITFSDANGICGTQAGANRRYLWNDKGIATLGSGYLPVRLDTNSSDVFHKRSGTDYVMYDASNLYANPSTTTADLTGIKIGSTSYKISGMPDGTAVSQGLVWDGTQWVKQAGYAYEASGTINPMKGTLLTYTGTEPTDAAVGDYWVDESETGVNEVIDTTPTQDSTNLVTSGGVYEAIKAVSVVPYVVQDSAPTDHTKMWIDSANSYVLKVYHNNTWISVGTSYK